MQQEHPGGKITAELYFTVFHTGSYAQSLMWTISIIFYHCEFRLGTRTGAAVEFSRARKEQPLITGHEHHITCSLTLLPGVCLTPTWLKNSWRRRSSQGSATSVGCALLEMSPTLIMIIISYARGRKCISHLWSYQKLFWVQITNDVPTSAGSNMHS